MAKVFIEESTLTAIGDAIRGKEGTDGLIPVTEMAGRIDAIDNSESYTPTSSVINITENGTYYPTDYEVEYFDEVIVDVPQDGAPTDEELTIGGYCVNQFYGSAWNWIIEKYGDRMTVEPITNAEQMFRENTLSYLPFDKIKIANNDVALTNMFAYSAFKKIPDIYIDNTTTTSGYNSAVSVFNACNYLEEVPYIYNFRVGGCSYLLGNCFRLRTIPEDWTDTWDFSYLHNNSSAMGNIFASCFSLRRIPENILKKFKNKTTSSYSSPYKSIIGSCYSLDEAKGIPVTEVTYTSNMMSELFYSCTRVKDVTFETNEDGTPKTANWKNQTISLINAIGYDSCYHDVRTATGRNNYLSDSNILKYNSGITADKFVYDDATYQALKDDPDWFTASYQYAETADYSRYNHDSAVNTINSLPDTSAYLATAGGTNTIKFKGSAGSLTDGGAINTLTEEEIAVATAKGWTVTLV